MYISECNHVYQHHVDVVQNLRMDDSYSRLLLAAKTLRGWGSQAELARGLTRNGYEVADPVLNNWKNRGVSKEGRLKACPIIGCRPHWVETGEGPMADAHFLNQQTNTEAGPEIIGRVPLISWVQAGQFCTAPDLLQPGDAEEWLPAVKRFGPHAYALRVVGDSMVLPYPSKDSFFPGTIIFVDPDKPLTNGAKVIAKIEGTEEATFKVYSEDGGKRYLKPHNPQYPVIEMDETMHICGVVVWQGGDV